MQFMASEQLKKKYLNQILELVRSDRPDAQTPNGFKADQWHAVCSGQVEVLVQNVLDLVEITIQEEQEAMAKEATKKPGNYMGATDDYKVVNGEYV
jgi:hypothetical protein